MNEATRIISDLTATLQSLEKSLKSGENSNALLNPPYHHSRPTSSLGSLSENFPIPLVPSQITSISPVPVPLPPPGFDEEESLLRAASSPGSAASPLHTPSSNGYQLVPDRRYNLPNKAVALKLVGKGGSTKNNIRDTTGVRIKIGTSSHI